MIKQTDQYKYITYKNNTYYLHEDSYNKLVSPLTASQLYDKLKALRIESEDIETKFKQATQLEFEQARKDWDDGLYDGLYVTPIIATDYTGGSIELIIDSSEDIPYSYLVETHLEDYGYCVYVNDGKGRTRPLADFKRIEKKTPLRLTMAQLAERLGESVEIIEDED